MKKPVDLMEVGINGNNLATSAMRQHPIEELQQRQGMILILNNKMSLT